MWMSIHHDVGAQLLRQPNPLPRRGGRRDGDKRESVSMISR